MVVIAGMQSDQVVMGLPVQALLARAHLKKAQTMGACRRGKYYGL